MAFFNLLTIALSFTLIDDSWWPAFVQRLVLHEPAYDPIVGVFGSLLEFFYTLSVNLVAAVVVGLVLLASLVPIVNLGRNKFQLGPKLDSLMWGKKDIAFLPQQFRNINTIYALYRLLSKFGILNSYGLFAVMTTSRDEVLVQGSDDLKDWQAYELHYKPGLDLKRPPPFVPPCHLPRLDWRLWFCQFRYSRWVEKLAHRLLTRETDVLQQFRVNPFGQRAPKYIRFILAEYQFVSPEENNQNGNFWQMKEKGYYGKQIFTLNSNQKLQIIKSEDVWKEGMKNLIH